MKSLFSIIQGWVRVKGNTDGTFIGNTGDSLKTNVTASALPTGASTSAKQDSQITQQTSTNTKLDTVIAKDFSTSAKQDSQITQATSTNTKLDTVIAKDFATSAKQDSQITQATSTNTKLDTIIAKDFATSAKQDVSNTKLDTIIAKDFATSAKQDSQITQATSTNTKLDTLNAKDFSTGAKQDTQITNQTTLNSRVGNLTETAPASDTASSGLNGRLQRIAQRISTFITGLTNGTYQIKLRGNTDGTNIGNVSDSLKTKVTSPVSGLDTSVTLANTTAVLAKVGATNLAGRTYVTLYAITKNVFWGYNTSCNFPLPIGSLIFVPANALCNVYVKTDNASPSKTVIVGES